jgi:hypothetical protein
VRPTSCARCGGPLPPAALTGRPRTTCSETCRKAVYRRRTTELAQQARSAVAAKAAKKAAGHRDAWWTPENLREPVRAEHGPLGLDAAACAESTLVPANWLGPTHDDPSRRDALAFDDWADLAPDKMTVYLNPPYTPAPLIAAFLATAARTAKAGVPVVALVRRRPVGGTRKSSDIRRTSSTSRDACATGVRTTPAAPLCGGPR